MTGMQAAVDMQLEEIFKSQPNKRVVMITFNNEVSIVGDGTQKEEIIAGDKLNDFEALTERAKEFKVQSIKPVKDARNQLSDKLFNLEESGATALGPGKIFCNENFVT